MTRKDYRAIGQAIRTVFWDVPPNTEPIILFRQVAREIAEVFAQDNPRFDRVRFLRFVETGNDSARSLSQTKRGEAV